MSDFGLSSKQALKLSDPFKANFKARFFCQGLHGAMTALGECKALWGELERVSACSLRFRHRRGSH